MSLARRGRPRERQRVVWTGAAAPRDEEAQAVMAALHQGLQTYGEIVRNVADRLFGHDLVMVGPETDVGLFRAWYLALACRVLERLDGQLIVIGEPPADARSHAKAR